MSSHNKIQELKERFGEHLSDASRLKRPEGIATSLSAFDRFLVWQGLPKGALSLFKGPLGTGATSMWIGAASNALRAGRFVAWIDRDVPLCPLPLEHRGLDLSRFVAIERPEADDKLFWLLQELMSSSLFDLIGCDLGDGDSNYIANGAMKRSFALKSHQVRKLQVQARDANVALVLLSQGARGAGRALQASVTPIFSLIVKFERNRLLVERALHRPTPHALPLSTEMTEDGSRPSVGSGGGAAGNVTSSGGGAKVNAINRSVYARFTLHTRDRLGTGSSHSSPERSPSSDSSALLASARESARP